MINVLISTTLIALGSLIGIFVLSLNRKLLNKILLLLVSLSAGTLLGGSFIHLLPEAVSELEPSIAFYLTLTSFSIFFIIERFLHWHHCHRKDCPQKNKHTLGVMNLFGDSVHNFLDGIIIAGAFSSSFSLGIITSITIALHEIPQEISDFGVLVYSGFSRKKALIGNFLVSSTIILGGIFGFIISSEIKNIAPYLISFAAGGFIYIAASDLIPELKENHNLKKSLSHFLIFLFGILLMYLMTFLE